MIDNEDVVFLREALPFWDKLSSEQQQMLTQNTSLVSYNQGECIHSGSSDCVGILIIKQGTLRAYLLSEEGREISLFRMYSKEVCVLSASCLLKDITFDVHVDAQEDSKVYVISPVAYSKISNENIYAENFTYKMTTERFSDFMWAMEQILFMSVDKRLAIFLFDEITKSGSDVVSLTHEQIARYIGSAREVISRMLKYFVTEGIVELSRGGVKIIDKAKLKALL